MNDEKNNLDESLGGTIRVSVLAGLLAIPGFLSAAPIVKAGNDPAKIQQIVNTEDNLNINIIARTLWYEAQGEGEDGIKAVMSVILNRAGGSKEKMKDVCLAKRQFSCWTSKSNVSKVLIPKGTTVNQNTKSIWELCKKVAADAYSGKFKSTIGTANSYYAPGSASPGWASSLKNVKTVGNHKFGYLPEHDGYKTKSTVKKPETKKTSSLTYTVKKGDMGVSYIAKDLIKNEKVKDTDYKKLTDKILKANKFKKDKKGNPIIKIGDKLTIPA